MTRRLVRPCPRGFTLIEVLVALVIVAVAVAALLGSLTSAANSTIYLRDKTFAHWIALNQITETRLAAAPPVNGKTDGILEYAGQRWQWQQEVRPSDLPGARQVDVRVRLLIDERSSTTITDKTSWMAEQTGFLGGSLGLSAPSLPTWEPTPAPPQPGGGGSFNPPPAGGT